MGVLNAGELDRLLSFTHGTPTQNAQNGEVVVGYVTPYATLIPAKRVDMRGTSRLIAQQVTAQQQVEYTIRYRTDVSVNDQITENGSALLFSIKQIAVLGRREALCILCSTVMP